MKSKLSKRFLSATVVSACILCSVALPSAAASAEDITVGASKVYNAAEYIKQQVDAYKDKEIFYPDAALWSMETAPIEKDSSDETYRLTDSPEWTVRKLKMHPNSKPFNGDGNVETKYLKPYMYYDSSLQDIPLSNKGKWIYGGIMSDGEFAGITSGYNWETASSLTFTAPESGTVKLYDPNGGKIQPWMYHNYKTDAVKALNTLLEENGKNESAGIAIYKNSEKIWPANKDYETVTRDSRTLDFPEISDIEVEKGDKIRIVIIPLYENRGYFEMNPVIAYVEDLKGDINGDGQVSEEDLLVLCKYLIAKTGESYNEVMDVNEDKVNDIRDLVRLNELIAGLNSEAQ